MDVDAGQGWEGSGHGPHRVLIQKPSCVSFTLLNFCAEAGTPASTLILRVSALSLSLSLRHTDSWNSTELQMWTPVACPQKGTSLSRVPECQVPGEPSVPAGFHPGSGLRQG